MAHDQSLLARELREAPAAVAHQGEALKAPLAALAARLRRKPPNVMITCARGSSAHAATFGKHLVEKYLGIPVAAAAPNIATVYRRDLGIADQFALFVSQSGQSDDLIEQARSARRAGAITAALVNETNSPLAAECEFVLPIAAGREQAVAATKSYVASLSALLRLAAVWTGEAGLQSAADRLAERLSLAVELDWRAALEALASAQGMIAIGRGPTLAIAREAALKLKETARLQAEAYSGAEFMHGPITLVSPGYPLLVFTPSDEAAAGLQDLSRSVTEKGAALLTTGGTGPGIRLPALPDEQPEADAICLIQSFYSLLPRLAEMRRTSADVPQHLKKVTRTR
jgi:glutamine---fructose-6-phosphate transaminase (isomerizing)